MHFANSDEPIVARVDAGDGVFSGTISAKSVRVCLTREAFGFILEALDNSPYRTHPMINLFAALNEIAPR